VKLRTSSLHSTGSLLPISSSASLATAVQVYQISFALSRREMPITQKVRAPNSFMTDDMKFSGAARDESQPSNIHKRNVLFWQTCGHVVLTDEQCDKGWPGVKRIFGRQHQKRLDNDSGASTAHDDVVNSCQQPVWTKDVFLDKLKIKKSLNWRSIGKVGVSLFNWQGNVMFHRVTVDC